VQQRSNTALILSIVGILCCNILCPVALFLGLAAKRDGGGGPATAAVIVGGIGTGLMVLGFIYFIVMMIIGASGGPGATPSPIPVP
jgi:hypothetical protein